MKRRLKNAYIGFRIQLRILRLRLMYLREPGDAKEPSAMLEEIKKKLKLT